MATIKTNIAPENRQETLQVAADTSVVFGDILNFPLGKYEFRIIDEQKAFSTLLVDISGNRKMTLFLVSGEVKSVETGKVVDKGHRSLAVDLPALWVGMKAGVVYQFEVSEYTAKKTNEDGTITEAIRKKSENWVEQGV